MEKFWEIVYSESDSGDEYFETYATIDEAYWEFERMTGDRECSRLGYAVLREVTTDFDEYQEIEEIERFEN